MAEVIPELLPGLVEWLMVTLVVAAGSACQATIGMGLNLLAIPLLALIDPGWVPGPVIAASLTLSLAALRRMPTRVDRTEVALAGTGLAIGTALAAIAISSLDTDDLIRVLGGLIVIAAVMTLFGWSIVISRPSLLSAGSASGFLGTIAGVHAPPIALLYQNQNPQTMRGTILVFIAIGNGLSLLTLTLADRFSLKELALALTMGPGMLAGLRLAPALACRLGADRMRLLVIGISAISGLILVIDS